jgi:hypothetical protein
VEALFNTKSYSGDNSGYETMAIEMSCVDP